MRLTRRDLLRRTTVATGGLLLAGPVGALADVLGPSTEFDTSRASRLFPGSFVVHADLHNHTLLSDGAGDPELAFESMRSAGLDVAALTDHSTVQKHMPVECLGNADCQAVAGIDEAAWARTRALADGADDPGSFVAIRGFEWSSPFLGHMNVWFSETWTDPLATGGGGIEGAGQSLHQEVPGLGPVLGPPLDGAIRGLPRHGAGMRLFYEWLTADPSRPLVGGGADGIAGFNHPGRETGRFGYFAFDAAVRDRIVSLELFNRREDYLFEGTEVGQPSPLVECLDAGWRVGLLGVTDEHGTDWGHPDGKGRGGLWVDELSREGVRTAMRGRRFFATRLRGLRLDAAATSGAAADPAARVRMGQELTHTSGPVTFELDIDRGSEWMGKELLVQVLRSGSALPTVAHAETITVGGPDDPLPTLTVDLDRTDGDWVVLRLTDPDDDPDSRAAGAFADAGDAVAYCSPWYLMS